MSLSLVSMDFQTAESQIEALVSRGEHIPTMPWDAYATGPVSLSDPAQDELLGDPYSALDHDGIDAYTGADTVLSGAHDDALRMVGWAMLEMNDD